MDAILALWEKLPWQCCNFTLEVRKLVLAIQFRNVFVCEIIMVFHDPWV